MHRFILHNDEIHEASEKLLSPGQVGLLSGWGVFTTIKVIGGVLFAFERHWARMSRDAALMRVSLPADPTRFEDNLLRLVEKNKAQLSTLRVNVVRNKGGIFEGPDITRPSDVIAFTADITNWGKSVKLDYVHQARHAASPFAGTKILAWGMNLTMLEDGKAKGFDEVILLNERGEVAECTSANIFAAKNGEVWTPPLSSGCLPGNHAGTAADRCTSRRRARIGTSAHSGRSRKRRRSIHQLDHAGVAVRVDDRKPADPECRWRAGSPADRVFQIHGRIRRIAQAAIGPSTPATINITSPRSNTDAQARTQPTLTSRDL